LEEGEKGLAWLTTVIRSMAHVLREERAGQKGIITRECYIKFLVKCPQFSLHLLT
jgi:hypothetical protein